MISSCPKCTTKIEIDSAKITDNDHAVSCQECKTRLLIFRESFAARATRKDREINCARCGGDLGHAIYCSGCGMLYPDYYVTETAEARRRKQMQKRWAAIKELNFSSGSASMPISTAGYSPERLTLAGPSSTSSKSKTLVVAFAGLVIVIALSTVGIKMYKQHQLERKYATYFTKALYGIKSGADYSLVVSDKIIKESRDKGTLRIGAGDEANLAKIKGIADQCLQELKEPPSKFRGTDERVQKVYGAYIKLHTTVVAPTGTTQSFSDAVTLSSSDFKSASKELKAALPEVLSEDLKKATIKYKNLKDF